MIGPKIMPYQGAEEPSHQPYIIALLRVRRRRGNIRLNAERLSHLDLDQPEKLNDAIASHGDNASLSRKFLDKAVLVLRQNIDFLDAELACDSFGSRLIVAGQYYDPFDTA